MLRRANFGITSRGNFIDHSDPDPVPGQNVLSIVEPNLPPGDESLLASAKEKMLAARAPGGFDRTSTTKCWPPGMA